MVASHVGHRKTDVCMLWKILSGHVRLWQTDMCRMKTILVTHVVHQLTCVDEKGVRGKLHLMMDNHVVHAMPDIY